MTNTEQRQSHPAWAWIKKRRNPILAVFFWLMTILVIRQYMEANQLSFLDVLSQLEGVLVGTWFGPLLYMIVYMLRPLILFPASLLTVLAGNVFGIWPGILYALLGGTASALFPYLIGRWFAADEAEALKTESDLQRFLNSLRRNPFQTVLMMRLIYLPYDAVSLLAGNLRIPFVIFFAATALGNLGGTLSFISVGASIEADLGSGDVTLRPEALLLSAVILVVSLVLSRTLNRSQNRQPIALSQESGHE